MGQALDREDRGALAEFFPSSIHSESELFAKIGQANDYKPATEWNLNVAKEMATKRLDRGVWFIRDMMDQSGLPDDTRGRITSTLQDIAWYNPHDKAVTTDTVGGLLANAALPEHTAQGAFFSTFKQDLAKASEQVPSHRPEAKELITTITQAAERTGLFFASENLLGGKAR